MYSGRINKTLQAKIQKCQNACMRFIFCIPRREHILPSINNKNILNMYRRRLLHTYCLIHKIITSGKPSYLADMLIPRTSIHSHHTRNNFKFNLPLCNTQAYQSSFSYSAAKIWSALPKTMSSISKIESFRNEVKNFLLAEQRLCSNTMM